jgi:hypothetical protein
VEGDRIAREKQVEFRVEYIAVDPAKLDRQNELLSRIGPVTGLQIQNGTTFSLDALPIVKVNYSEPGMPVWNTIHVLGRFPGRDAAANRAALDAAIRQIIPGSGSYDALFAPCAPLAYPERIACASCLSWLSADSGSSAAVRGDQFP